MAQNEIAAATRAICEEKGITLEAVVEAIESALAAAYRKDFGQKNQNIKVDFDLETAKSKVYDEKIVVEDMPEEEEGEQVTTGEQGASEKEADDNKKIKKLSASFANSAGGQKNKKQKNKKEETAEEAGKKEEKQDAESSDNPNEEEEVRRFNPRSEIQLTDAKNLKKSAKVGDIIKTDLEVPAEYGRMAAQTAKQVIIQRIREIERSNLLKEFKEKEHEVLTGVVQRREGRIVLVDLGRTAGILTADGQVPGERYEPGQRIKVYVEGVNTTAKGPEIILSRTSDEIVRKIFMLEIPEISNGLVEIKAVSREAGSRSKIAVYAAEDNVDPIGSCVGQRGARIQTIIGELSGEKVDIIEYDEDQTKFIANSLSPAKVLKVEVNEGKRIATAMVAADQLSLAIGRGGQNVRLAARLTGWKIDVKEAKAIMKPENEKSEDEESKKNEARSTKSKIGDQKPDIKDEDEVKNGKEEDTDNQQKNRTEKILFGQPSAENLEKTSDQKDTIKSQKKKPAKKGGKKEK
ncbi:transcription termination/antitermination protein NusA [Candidatus Falkowbacteria bacterium CG10_big_fil_rev_8_21_14_0_10_43_10]|uniref:Transcription termination/antitermination protein NusA n=1 Tax=Candidatus Falkowbacteria bacterium CG10_big_fil_rev_8_21_14_0_10_43_10 TaxID=1974567 RepID=A0A2H0V2F3_9BACT|nr:MAG: transcription termination/antitermination protein NusA [Candidatus Falkowbacteria bacterium CG10_big_fil_rev_8_21_14_0_10_43_10]